MAGVSPEKLARAATGLELKVIFELGGLYTVVVENPYGDKKVQKFKDKWEAEGRGYGEESFAVLRFLEFWRQNF